MADHRIRVLVVDDSIFFLKMLERALGADSQIEVVGTAMNASEAEKKIKRLDPDVVTLDIEMPQMNGIDFLRKLIPEHPVPVIVVSSLPIRVLDALEAGAVDFVRKAGTDSAQDRQAFFAELKGKVRMAATAKVVRKKLPAKDAATPGVPLTLTKPAVGHDRIIAIGASTGGTEAILQTVRDLPATTPGILVVQHMPPVFTKMYAERLNGICKMRVGEAVDGERVEPGKIIVAAGDHHLRLMRDTKGFYIRSSAGEKVSGHCPSVDVMFESVATLAKDRAIGILLTGMGSDGAEGLLKMRGAGAYTIGQDKNSCAVYGMPQVAYNLGAVTKQLPLDHIGADVVRYLNQATN